MGGRVKFIDFDGTYCQIILSSLEKCPLGSMPFKKRIAV